MNIQRSLNFYLTKTFLLDAIKYHHNSQSNIFAPLVLTNNFGADLVSLPKGNFFEIVPSRWVPLCDINLSYAKQGWSTSCIKFHVLTSTIILRQKMFWANWEKNYIKKLTHRYERVCYIAFFIWSCKVSRQVRPYS